MQEPTMPTSQPIAQQPVTIPPGQPSPVPGTFVAQQSTPIPVFTPIPSQPIISRRSRVILVLMLILVAVLSLGGALALQITAQFGLARAYPQPQVTIALISAAPYHSGDSIDFNANGQGRDLTYSWDFGDGETAVGQNASHAYSSTGSFTVTVEAVDPVGQAGRSSTSIVVQTALPVASFTATTLGLLSVDFDATASHADPSLIISNYHWDFGDGSTDDTVGPLDFHAYIVPGDYTVTLVVTDSNNQASQPASQTVSPQE